jgi:hypothetical protein
VNDAMAGMQKGLQAVSLAQDSGLPPLALNTIGNAAIHMITTGQLHNIEKLTKQAKLLGKQPGGPMLPDVGLPYSCQAELLRERNEHLAC